MLTYPQSTAIIQTALHCNNEAQLSALFPVYAEACETCAGFHQRAIAIFATALAPEWLGQAPSFKHVTLVGVA